jgi:beta-galactosidase
MRRIFALAITAIVFLSMATNVWAASQDKPAPVPSKQAAKPTTKDPVLVLGTAWYPEQWPEARWEQDLALMQAAGINMVRVSEFAWSTMEPQEGQFNFAWLDRAVALAAKHGIRTVLGTPSAAPPAWLTQKYPETLAVWDNGRTATHGNRGQYRFTSQKYLQLSRRMAEEMAKHFGHNPNVIGWQIDNEYGSVSYDEETRKDFQQFLKARYKTLESLNQHWSTAYWSQAYDTWEEIPLGAGNPGLNLEWKRFVSETFKNYQHNQIAVIRANSDPRQFITHNFMGFNGNFDHYVLSEELDFASWDHYVAQGRPDALWNGQVHDLTRGFKRKNFWIMETQPGFVNWSAVNLALDKGEVRQMAWSDVGHGADAVSFWQWRSALGGQEQYHGSIVAPDGNPRPIYEEVAQLGKEFAKAGEALSGTTPTPETAILFDYNSRWAIEFQRHSKDFDPVGYLHTFYRPLRQLTQDVDIVNPSAPLSQYKLVVAPALNVMPEATAQHLVDYVNNGGHLVIGARTGMKDEYNALLPSRQPGTALNKLLGGDVVEFYALENNVPVDGQFGKGEAKVWAELLETTSPDTEVLLKYGKSNGWLDGKPAVISRKVGKGRITYVGAQLSEDVMGKLAQWMVDDSGVKPALGTVPEGVEVSRRAGNGKEVFIVVNSTSAAQTISLPAPMHELLKEAAAATSLTLAAGDVGVLVPTGK